MLTAITKTIKQKWQRLTRHSGNRRLSWFALLLAFALDGYVLSLLFDGTQNAMHAVERPIHGVPRDCQFISYQFLQDESEWHFDLIATYAVAVNENKERAAQDLSNYSQRLIPLCAQMRDQWIDMVSAPAILAFAQERKQLSEQIQKIESDILKLKATYSEALLEKIAKQKRRDSILPVEATEIKSIVDEMSATLAALRQKKSASAANIIKHPKVAAYIAYLQSLPIGSEMDKETEHHERAMFWYPIKTFGAQAAFILPLLLLAIYWNAWAIKKQQDIRIIISSHLILVTAIPVLIRLLYFIRELLPEQLLYQLFELLDQMRLSFVWYYLLIFACIGVGLLAIFLAQRTLFSPARLRAIRLRKAQCQACGEKLRSGEQTWCEVCGASQAAPCRQCGQPRRLLAHYCGHCGTSA